MNYSKIRNREQLLAEKQKTFQALSDVTYNMRDDLRRSFLPESDDYFEAPSGSMKRAIGYAITGYKTAMSISKVMKFFKKKKR